MIYRREKRDDLLPKMGLNEFKSKNYWKTQENPPKYRYLLLQGACPECGLLIPG
jgi:hypothetical protein